MPRLYNDVACAGAFPPRTVAFCRAATLAVLSALGTSILVLALAALLGLQLPRPSFAQTPDGGPDRSLEAPSD